MSARIALPPLNALRVFHAVARHRSLREAAEELLVTPQAVGQQVRLLEETLGVALVERDGRRIRLTEAAMTLSHYLNAGFDEFAEGIRRATAPAGRKRIHLNVSPYFATRYLMPHLGALRRALPDLELSLTTMIDLVDFSRDQIDLSVLWGYDNRSEHPSNLLIKDPKVICCAPALAGAIRGPADLLGQVLLHPLKGPRLWPDILRFLGLDPPPAQAPITFDDAATMRRAAQQGIGVGLVSVMDAQEDIHQGRLVAPLGLQALAGLPDDCVPGFYLIAPKAKLRARHVAALHRWMCAEPWSQAPPAIATAPGPQPQD